MLTSTDELVLELLRHPNTKQQDEGFRQLYKAHYGMIEKMVLANNGSQAAANDVFQDALITLFEKVRRPDFQLTAKLSTFLYAIARNLWLMQLRKHKKETQLKDTHQHVAADIDLAADFQSNECSQLLSTVLDKMGGDCRKILIWYYYERLRMKEIMSRMNYGSEQVAKNKKSRCMRKLRELALADARFMELRAR